MGYKPCNYSIGRKLAIEIIKKFPKTPTLTLAKKLVKDNPGIYRDVEHARSCINTSRGTNGNTIRRKSSDKSLYGTSPGKYVPFLPDAEPDNWQPFHLPKANDNILHLQDLHVPYHSKETLELAVQYGIGKKINTLLIGYDFIDFYQCSRFEKDPRKRSIKYEIDTANQILDYLQHKFPKAKVFWRNGNHDERLMRYLRVKAPELLDLEVLQISELLHFAKRGITMIPDKQIVYAGNLAIIHGHEYQGGTPSAVNPARGLYVKSNANSLCGHSHKTSEHTDPNINGDVSTTYSVGCCCGLHPEYAALTKWNHGFAHILVYPDGHFHVNNMKVINGKIV